MDKTRTAMIEAYKAITIEVESKQLSTKATNNQIVIANTHENNYKQMDSNPLCNKEMIGDEIIKQQNTMINAVKAH